jgi:signal transduction histidine kinase
MLSASRKTQSNSLYAQVVRQQSRAFVTLSCMFILIVAFEMLYGFRQQVVNGMKQNAQLVELTVIPAIRFQDSRSLRECLEVLSRDQLIQQAYLKSPEGEILASFVQRGRKLRKEAPNWWQIYAYRYPIVDGQETLAILHMDRSLGDLTDIFARSALAMLVTTIVLLLIFHNLRKRLSTLLDGSFKSLSECIDSLAHNRSPNIAEVKGRAAKEFYDVIEHFDAMAVAIRSRDESLNRINEELELRVQTRTEEIRNLHEKLVHEAHKAGMADLASAIIHNFGNILNSLMIETQKIKEYQENLGIKPHMEQLFLALQPDSIRSILSDDAKSKLFQQYVQLIRSTFESDNSWLNEHLLRMIEQQKVMQSMLVHQQNFVQDKEPLQTVYADELADLALKIKSASLQKRSVRIAMETCPRRLILVKKSKLIHVITNLIVNAMDAMSANKQDDRIIRIAFNVEEKHLRLRFEDNGSGISPEALDKIFKQGFTTKESGHGFGLHSSANYMKEMGGTLELAKQQPARGAAFELTMLLHVRTNESEPATGSAEPASGFLEGAQ